MFGRRTLYAGAMATAIGGPYLATTGQIPSQVKEFFSSSDSSTESTLPLSAEGGAGVVIPGMEILPLEGEQVQSFGEIFRFDITPAWVTARWPRVTSGLAEVDLNGLRVPLVTGGDVDDLAGSLTYYFDSRGELQRITFRGTTGDHRRLAGFVQQYYEMEQQPSLDSGLYLRRRGSQPVSVLRVELASVVRADMPHQREGVMMELNRDGRHFRLSETFAALLDADHRAGQW